MTKVLLLVHRLPYPPNKGDKVRSFHLLKHLAAQHEVYLGTFVDDPVDWQYVDTVRSYCAELHVAGLHPLRAKLSSLRGLATGEALSLPYYRDEGLARWVANLLRTESLDAVVVFSSVMAQYVRHLAPDLPVLVDFVDVDSAKWSEYASRHSWPLSWLYRREGRALLAFEAELAAEASVSFFVTDKEAALFRSLAPQLRASVETLCNGVDADFFSPDSSVASPFPDGQTALVFTGAMDYWPNADAVIWFAESVLPALCTRFPGLHFHIVGRNPTPAVQALKSGVVSVSGTVADVRPYLTHAAAVVAPLRLARGVQNKILEAMAMARPVVAAACCVNAIDAVEGEELLAAEEPQDYVEQLSTLLLDSGLAERLGRAARARVLASYSWSAHLSGIDKHLDGARRKPAAGAAAQ